MSLSDQMYHNEGRAPTMQDVQAIMTKIREGSRKNPPISGIRLRRMMIEKAGGYPKELYHAALDPVTCLSEEQEEELKAIGYQETYIPHEYPKMLYRRNMHQRFAFRTDPATGVEGHSAIGDVQPGHYVEARTVKDKATEEKLLKEKAGKHTGPWRPSLAEVEAKDELPDMEGVDLAQDNARLRGRLEEIERQAAAKK